MTGSQLTSRLALTQDLDLLQALMDAARIRAMYTHPHHVRKGVGRLIIGLCEAAAKAEGFRRIELMATMAGQPLYRACGCEPAENVEDNRGGEPIPLLPMQKQL
jgi:GNAT superfamily N-acetyltransferase